MIKIYMGFLGGRTSDTANDITSLGQTKIWQKSRNNFTCSLKEETIWVTHKP